MSNLMKNWGESTDIYANIFNKYKNNNTIFVETGTHLGSSVRRALGVGYERILSVEPFDQDYLHCKNLFKDNPQVSLFHGYSEDLFSKMMDIVTAPATIFLDAHTNSWFKEGTMPLAHELSVLQSHPIKNHTIIVDDYEHGCGISCVSEIIKIINTINDNYRFEAIRRQNGILVAHLT